MSSPCLLREQPASHALRLRLAQPMGLLAQSPEVAVHLRVQLRGERFEELVHGLRPVRPSVENNLEVLHCSPLYGMLAVYNIYVIYCKHSPTVSPTSPYAPSSPEGALDHSAATLRGDREPTVAKPQKPCAFRAIRPCASCAATARPLLNPRTISARTLRFFASLQKSLTAYCMPGGTPNRFGKCDGDFVTARWRSCGRFVNRAILG